MKFNLNLVAILFASAICFTSCSEENMIVQKEILPVQKGSNGGLGPVQDVDDPVKNANHTYDYYACAFIAPGAESAMNSIVQSDVFHSLNCKYIETSQCGFTRAIQYYTYEKAVTLPDLNASDLNDVVASIADVAKANRPNDASVIRKFENIVNPDPYRMTVKITYQRKGCNDGNLGS